MTKQFVILGHSTVNNNKEETVPPGVKLVFPTRCGSSLSKNRLLRPLYGNEALANKFSKGENIRKNIPNLQKAYKVNEKGLERFIHNPGNKYINQYVNFFPSRYERGKVPFHSGVYKLPINIQSSSPYMPQLSVWHTSRGSYKLSTILTVLKSMHEKNNIVVHGHFCRTFKNFNKENFRNRVREIKTANGKKYRLTKNEIMKLYSRVPRGAHSPRTLKAIRTVHMKTKERKRRLKRTGLLGTKVF